MLEVRQELAHEWKVPLQEAAAIQRRLSHEIRPLPIREGGFELAAGVDVAYTKDRTRAFAAAVVMDRDLRIVATAHAEGSPDSAYVPGYLAFREGRLTLEALCALEVEPDVAFLDGHGVVHARGCGLASHVGVLLGLPTVGLAKAPFHAVDRRPGPRRGDHFVINKEWGAQGASIRLKAGVKPVFVSPGHLVDLEGAIRLALAWSSGTRRRAEPLAVAHTLSLLARNRALGVY
jgi:deoxyribonuclease V